ncbi:MAG: hypothetical protein OQJ99_05225 [Rhodospirillales bacterium]|nr:hypothetical protein [Rhodospirillales bacterium]MCW8862706.1 hypothetical protein [Rhodospirillales bacterium]MCW8952865.1 hypothetical protein [Rhodospirillales bacterium]MCW8970472.1 hypothetical protein [Rhodospirillales bacterium]MCW9002830.1 hypothetical protein [Rhodospirillales bacterium]
MAGAGGGMMRSTTLIALVLAAALAGVLFKVKYEVIDLEADLSAVNRDILANQEAIHVLKAEWAFLNDPNRLRALSERHLGLKPVTPHQMKEFADLPAPGNDQGAPASVLPVKGGAH